MKTIAYLGPENTHTHLAAKLRFGRKCTYIHAPTIDDVFHIVERQQADFGVVPIENSLGGAVAHTLDRFIEFKHSPIKIHGEIEQPIHHYLIHHSKANLMSIRAVYSHPQALAQCHLWLAKHLPYAKLRETDSTADAVWYILHDKSKHARAAIGRQELVKQQSSLKALRIPNYRENKTRFLVLGLDDAPRTKHTKTSLMFALKDKPGALYDALMPFKKNKINLTKIESRPSKRKAWQYLFFIDFEGHENEQRVGKALQALKRSTSDYQLLGSYPVREVQVHSAPASNLK